QEVPPPPLEDALPRGTRANTGEEEGKTVILSSLWGECRKKKKGGTGRSCPTLSTISHKSTIVMYHSILTHASPNRQK
ncbi:hypothetical protein VIGAN_01298000, partial [Vigna angularis var. angularis]